MSTELLLYGEIGADVNSRSIKEALTAATGSPVTVRVNSPGGDITEGLAIFAALRSHGQTTVVVDSLAASAAAVAICGAQRVTAVTNALFMIHKSWVIASGGASALQSNVDALHRIDEQITQILAARTGKTAKEIQTALEKETWLNAIEALDFGLIDEILPATDTTPKFGSWRPPRRHLVETSRHYRDQLDRNRMRVQFSQNRSRESKGDISKWYLA